MCLSGDPLAYSHALRNLKGRTGRARVGHLKKAHPAKLVKLTLVGMEHEMAGAAVGELKNVAFGLAHGDNIGVIRWLQSCPSAIYIEEIGMQME